MLTFTVEELIRFLSNWTMTFFEGAKRSGDIVFSRYYSFFKKTWQGFPLIHVGEKLPHISGCTNVRAA